VCGGGTCERGRMTMEIKVRNMVDGLRILI
jgi:hypothetical protein